MPTPDITINKGYYLLTLTTSTLGVTEESYGVLKFGLVQLAADTATRFEAGQTVFFSVADAKMIKYAGTYYYIVPEEKIFFNESTILV